jgi:hypothetical protein
VALRLAEPVAGWQDHIERVIELVRHAGLVHAFVQLAGEQTMLHGFSVDPANTDTNWHPWKPFKLTLKHDGTANALKYYNYFHDAWVLMPGTPDNGQYHQCKWPMIRCRFSIDPVGNVATTNLSVTIHLKTSFPYPLATGPASLFLGIIRFFYLVILFTVPGGPIRATGPRKVIGSSATGTGRTEAHDPAVAASGIHDIEVFVISEPQL